MSRKSRRFVPSVPGCSLEPRKLLDGSGLPTYPGPANPPPTFPGDSNLPETLPPDFDPLAPVFIFPRREPGVVNMEDGTNAAYSVQ